MKKFYLAIFTGFAIMILGMGLGKILSFFLPVLDVEYDNRFLFRPWSDPLMSIYWFHPFVTALILLWFWNITKVLLIPKSNLLRACVFGFSYWMITMPGMIISYSTFQISLIMVMSWSLIALLQAILAGIIYSKVQP